MQIDKPIVLVGLMGAGKSTVGQRLAERLGIDFVDIDHLVEAKEGRKIADIFSSHGEEYFRKLERETIKSELTNGKKVIATGGGAFMNAETRKLIKQKATSVWLRAGIDMIMERVSRNEDRPLLQGGDKKEILKKLMEERHPTYAEADLVVDSDDGPHYKVVDQIIWKL